MALSFAHSYPSLDYTPTFQFKDLQARLQHFLQSFDLHVDGAREAIRETKQAYQNSLKQEKERVDDLSKHIALLEAKKIELRETLAKESDELEENLGWVEELTAKKLHRENDKSEARESVDALQRELDQKTQAINARKEVLRKMSESLQPEYQLLEDLLALKIEKNGDGRISFAFTHINESDWSAVYSFTVEAVSKFEVISCDPMLPNLQELTDEANNGKFYRFIKLMRKGFVDHAKSNLNIS